MAVGRMSVSPKRLPISGLGTLTTETVGRNTAQDVERVTTGTQTSSIDQSTLTDLLNQFLGEREERYGQGLSALGRAANLFGPSYLKGQEKTALASAEQSLVGRGLGGTTRSGAVSGGIKTGFEDIRKSRLADALGNIAQYIQGGTPTSGELSHLATGGFGGGLEAAKLQTMLTPINVRDYPYGTVFPWL